MTLGKVQEGLLIHDLGVGISRNQAGGCFPGRHLTPPSLLFGTLRFYYQQIIQETESASEWLSY